MDRLTEDQEKWYQQEVERLRAEIARLGASKRPVYLPGKPLTGLSIFILGLLVALGVYFLSAWLDHFVILSRYHALEVGSGVALAVGIAFAVKAATRGESYDEELSRWRRECDELRK